MSANRNAEAMTPAQGQFKNKVPRSEPLTTKGHAPGVKVGNDAAPEFHLEQHPPGTAPQERSFQPEPTGEIPGQADNSAMASGTSAADTIGGATSADMHQGYGHPGSGMTSQELHGGKHKHVGSGLEGVGASGSDPIHERGFDRDYETGTRGKSNDAENWPPAENRESENAERVASERA